MDKIERETQDFMSVESFSQLPFIRPAPPANKEKGIRLFGIEFGAGDNDKESSVDNNNVCDKEDEDSNRNHANNHLSNKSSSESESSRRFECHYCCRNFPTSQALGGHQNAHKRERQHAKREHLQSAMVHGGLVTHDAAHVYGLMNYSRLGSAHHHPTYPSWNSTSYNSSTTTTTSPRFYRSSAGSYGTQSAPINGSPLGLWRIPSSANPSFGRDRSSLVNPIVTPLFAGEELKPTLVAGGSANHPQSRYVYESSVQQQDPVSLDLHL